MNVQEKISGCADVPDLNFAIDVTFRENEIEMHIKDGLSNNLAITKMQKENY